MSYERFFCDDDGDGAPALMISVRADTTRAVLTLAGEIDVATLPRLHEALAAVQREGHRTIDVVMGEVNFMSAAALSELERFHRSLLQRGGKLVLLNPQPIIRRLFAVCGLETQLNLLDG